MDEEQPNKIIENRHDLPKRNNQRSKLTLFFAAAAVAIIWFFWSVASKAGGLTSFDYFIMNLLISAMIMLYVVFVVQLR